MQSNRSAAYSFALLIVLSSLTGLLGQAKAKPAADQTKNAAPDEEVEAACIRLGVLFGGGVGKSTHGFLSETGSSWMVNSFIRTALDPTSQIAVPIGETAPVFTSSRNAALRMTWTDRWIFLAGFYQVDQNYARSGDTSVNFHAPANSDYFASSYEGARLLHYAENRNTFDVQYVHPTPFDRLHVGGFLGYMGYSELNEGSYGSYTSSRSTAAVPNTITWAEGGSVSTSVRMRSFVWGLAVRFRAFDWLVLSYRAAPSYRRSGSMNGGGFQTVSLTGSGGSASRNVIFPFLTGRVIDKGSSHNLEITVPVFCRYEVHFGFTHEEYKRSYENYFGMTLPASSAVAVKTSGLGFGETSSKHKVARDEAYLRVSVMVDWDDE